MNCTVRCFSALNGFSEQPNWLIAAWQCRVARPWVSSLGLLQVAGGVGFADLEYQRLRRQARGLQRHSEPGQQAGVLQAGAGQVDEQLGLVPLGAMLGEQLDRVEDHPAVDLLRQSGFLGGMQELRRRHFLALRIEQAQEHLVVLVAVAAQADDWLEQQAEAVGLQRLLEDRDDVAALGGGGEFFRRVVLLDLRTALACRLVGAAMRAVHHVLGLGGLLVEAGDADAEGGLGAAAVQLEKVVLDLLQQPLQCRLCLLGSLALEQGGEDRVAETRQVGFLAELFAHQPGQLPSNRSIPESPWSAWSEG